MSTSSTAVTRDYGKRVAIVTGSGRGIGKAIALRLAADGFSVCVNDISANQALINSTVAEIQALGRSALGFAADVTKSAEVQALISACVSSLGPLNVMVANAGIAQVKAVLDLTEEDVRRVFDVNVVGVFNSYQLAAKQMIAQGTGGKIIGAASIAAFRTSPMLAHYGASKYAVKGLTVCFAGELAKERITVNAYAPGIVGTEMWDMIDEGLSSAAGLQKGDALKGIVSKEIALGRVSVPEDVAKLVSYLASPDSDYMTGQTLIVDGGIIMA